MRYSVSFLLLVIALVAVTLTVCRWFDWQARALLLLAGLWVTFGYVGGWFAAKLHGSVSNSVIPAIVLVAFNWLLWYLNHLALLCVSNTDQELAEVLQRMLDAERIGFFEFLAVMFTALIGISAWKNDRRFLFHFGTACCLTWLIIVTVGYVVACASV